MTCFIKIMTPCRQSGNCTKLSSFLLIYGHVEPRTVSLASKTTQGHVLGSELLLLGWGHCSNWGVQPQEVIVCA